MKGSIVLTSIIGSLAVYVAMVACTHSESSTSGRGDGGSGQGEGGSGTTGNDGGNGAGMPNAHADPVSGGRLKAKFIAGEDGSKGYIPGVWYDSQRQEDCTFELAVDGQQRCLPTNVPVANLAVYFSDPSCTTPIAYVTPGCVPKYVTATNYTTACGFHSALTAVWERGPKIPSDSVYQASGGCIQSSAGSVYDFYALGPEILPPAFVLGTVATDP